MIPMKSQPKNYKSNIIKRAEAHSPKKKRKASSKQPEFSDDQGSEDEYGPRKKTKKSRKSLQIVSDDEDEDDISDYEPAKKTKAKKGKTTRKTRKSKPVAEDSDEDDLERQIQDEFDNQNRLDCLREILFANFAQRCVKAMAAKVLPNELINEIMDMIVVNNCDVIDLQPGKPLLHACKSALGDKNGTSAIALVDFFTPALFKSNPIFRIDLAKWNEMDIPDLLHKTLAGANKIEIVATSRAACSTECMHEENIAPINPFQISRATAVLKDLTRRLRSDADEETRFTFLESFSIHVNFNVVSCDNHTRKSSWYHEQVWREGSSAYAKRKEPIEFVKPLLKAFLELDIGSEPLMEFYTTRSCGDVIERRRGVVRADEEYEEAVKIVERNTMT